MSHMGLFILRSRARGEMSYIENRTFSFLMYLPSVLGDTGIKQNVFAKTQTKQKTSGSIGKWCKQMLTPLCVFSVRRPSTQQVPALNPIPTKGGSCKQRQGVILLGACRGSHLAFIKTGCWTSRSVKGAFHGSCTY